jgi:hypothetical protein
MWIVKTLGRRTRNGVDRVYSVNGAVITQDVEEAADAAIDVLREEMAGDKFERIYGHKGNQVHHVHSLPGYWDGTLTTEQIHAMNEAA